MTIKNNPLVSVVMPAYNAEATLIQSLLSVQDQTMGDWELLVVDDGSTDRTRCIAEHFSKRDSRIKYVGPAGERGAGRARQRAVALAKGEFVAFLDADDIWLAEKLEETMEHMRGSGSEWAHTQYRVILKSGKIGRKRNIRGSQRLDSVLAYNPISLSTVVVKRQIIPTKIDFYSRFGHDRQLWIQLFLLGRRPTYLDSASTLYRLSSTSLSSRKLVMAATRFRNLKLECRTERERIVFFIIYAFRASTVKLLGQIPGRSCEREKSLVEMLEQKARVIKAKLKV